MNGQDTRTRRWTMLVVAFFAAGVGGVFLFTLLPMSESVRGPGWVAFVATVTTVTGAILTPWRRKGFPLKGAILSLALSGGLGAFTIGAFVYSWYGKYLIQGSLIGGILAVLAVSLLMIIFTPKH